MHQRFSSPSLQLQHITAPARQTTTTCITKTRRTEPTARKTSPPRVVPITSHTVARQSERPNLLTRLRDLAVLLTMGSMWVALTVVAGAIQ